MTNIQLHSILTLEDGKKYVVVARTVYNGIEYDYLLQLSDNGQDITNKVAIVKEEKQENEIYIVVVTNAEELQSIMPLFQNQLEEQ